MNTSIKVVGELLQRQSTGQCDSAFLKRYEEETASIRMDESSLEEEGELILMAQQLAANCEIGIGQDSNASMAIAERSPSYLHPAGTSTSRAWPAVLVAVAACLLIGALIWAFQGPWRDTTPSLVNQTQSLRVQTYPIVAKRNGVRGDRPAAGSVDRTNLDDEDAKFWVPARKNLENYFQLSLPDFEPSPSKNYWYFTVHRKQTKLRFARMEPIQQAEEKPFEIRWKPDREQNSEVIVVIVDQELTLPDELDANDSSDAEKVVREWLMSQGVKKVGLGRIVFVPTVPDNAEVGIPRDHRLVSRIGNGYEVKPAANLHLVSIEKGERQKTYGKWRKREDEVVVLEAEKKRTTKVDFGESYQLSFSAELKDSTQLIVDFKMNDGLSSILELERKDGRLKFAQNEGGRAIGRALRLPAGVNADDSLWVQVEFRMHFGLAVAVIDVSQGEYERKLTTRLYGEVASIWPVELNLSSSQSLKLDKFQLNGEKRTRDLDPKDERLLAIERLRRKSEAHRKKDELPAAIEACHKAITKTEQVFGKDSIESTWFLNQLAILARDQGRVQDSHRLYEKTILISDNVLGPDHPESAITRSNYGLQLSKLGYWVEAKHNLKRGLESYQLNCIPNEPSLYDFKNNYVDVLVALGDWSSAFRIYKEILDARLKARRTDPAAIATAYNNLGYVFSMTGFSEKAIGFFEKALKIRVELYRDEPLHENLIRSKQNLASTLTKLKRSDEAIPLLREVLDAWLKRAEKNDVQLDSSLVTVSKSLAYANICERRYDEALECVMKAREISDQLYPANHPENGSIGYLEGLCLIGKGQRLPGRAKLKRAIEIYRELFDLKYAFLSFAQRQQQLQNYRTALDYYLSSFDPGQDSIEETYNVVSSWNSVIRQRRLAELELHDQPELNSLIEELKSIASALSQVSYSLKGDEDERVSLRRRKAEVERQLYSAGITKPLVSKPPSEVLGERDVYLDFFEYVKFESDQPGKGTPRLMVFVCKSAETPVAIDLGDAKVVRREVSEWVRCIQESDDDDIAESGMKVRERVWNPMASEIGESAKLLISRAGPVSQLPFCTLPMEKGYLIQRNSIRFVYSNDDLHASDRTSQSVRDKEALLVGGLSYDSSDHIPSSLDEVDSIAETLKGTSLGKVDLRTGSLSKAMFQSILSNQNELGFLHCACHGRAFSVADEMVDEKLALGKLDDGAVLSPLDFVYLQFSGQKSQSRLTGTQITTFDLRNLDLAVLSACDTGRGDETYGDVAMSLANAFRMAGAGGVVSNLWQAEDHASMVLMKKLYEFHFLNGMDISESLHETQLWMLEHRDFSHPAFWAGWEYNGR